MRVNRLLLIVLFLPALARAAIVQQNVHPGINAQAEYLAGKRDKPALLVLHGFLQTREFPTVTTLARGLHDSGYTVLTPTLSLLIPNRSQSLACEAVHMHRLEDDLAELSHWIAWLKKQGHRQIILMGHSFGSLQLLAYLSDKPDQSVKGFIGASLIEAQVGKASRQALITQLKNRVRQGNRALVTYPLSYCKSYTSSPEGILSYAYWDQAHLLEVLRRSPVDIRLIMGTADSMVGSGWLRSLQNRRIPMVVITGANHFMDGTHEFDLLEHTLGMLDEMSSNARP